MGNALSGTTSPSIAESTLGIIAWTDINDTLATQVNVLAYKHYDQQCAYYPDSAPGLRDKRNVRDGHYAIWGPMHFYTYVNPSNGLPTDANVNRIRGYLTGTQSLAGVDLIKVGAQNNVIPQCAMRVSRSTEMGAMASYAPPNACGCYFESIRGTSSCKTCSTDQDCPAQAPKCNKFGPQIAAGSGYCETQ
jgi:hypothetical protein